MPRCQYGRRFQYIQRLFVRRMSEYFAFYYNYEPIQQHSYVCYNSDTKGYFRANKCVNRYQLIYCSNPCKHVLQQNQVMNMYSDNDGYAVSSLVAGSYFFNLHPFSRVVFDFSQLSGPYKANFYVFNDFNMMIRGIETIMGEKVEVSRTCSDNIDGLYRFNQTVLIIIFSRSPDLNIGGYFSTGAMTSFSCPPSSSPTFPPSSIPTNLPTPGSYIPTMPSRYSQYPTFTVAPTSRNPTIYPVKSVIPTSVETAVPVADRSAVPILPRRRPPSQSPTVINTKRNISLSLTTPSNLPSATAGPSISSINDAVNQFINSNIIVLIMVMIPIFLLVGFLAAGMVYCRKIMRTHDAEVVEMGMGPPISATATAAVETVAYASTAATEEGGPGGYHLFSRNRNKVAVASITDDDNLPIAELYSQNNDTTSPVSVFPSATVIEMI